MNAFTQSDQRQWMVARFLVGVGMTVVLIGVMIVLGRPCRIEAIYYGLIWGGGLGPAFSVAFFYHLRHRAWAGTILRFFLVGIATLIVMQGVVANLVGAGSRGQQAKAMADMRGIAQQIEAGMKPGAARDPWGGTYIVETTPAGYRIVSYGECSEPDLLPGQGYTQGSTNSPECDLVYSNGQFIRYPEGKHP